MMMLQLFIFAFLFFTFGIISIIRKKRFIGFTFILLGIMLAAVAYAVIMVYPEKSPF